MSDTPDADRLDEIASVADHAALGVILFDGQRRVQRANEAAHRVLGRRPGSLIGRSVMETLVDHRLEAMVQAAAAGQVGGDRIESTDGATAVVRAHPAAGGGVWVTLQDITELEALRRVRSEFIDNVSHELRTPITNIRLMAEMLADELATTDVPEHVRERVAAIDVESGHLAQMINELLDLSRIEQTTIVMRHDAVDPGALVQGCVARLATFADRRDVVLRVELPPHPRSIRGDEERLDQLLMNLLHNAIKFSPGGGTVTVTVDEPADSAVISVRDEGVGIPAGDQARVFERFYKVDRARERGLGGTGLGLAIARHIVEAHGGRIGLESTEGAGSTFMVSLPLA